MMPWKSQCPGSIIFWSVFATVSWFTDVFGHFLGEDKFWAKILKTDDFVSLIAPQKQPLQNNYCIPWRSQRKILRDKNNQKFWGCFLGVVICLTKSTCFFDFLKNVKIGDFVLQISPWRQHLQRKWSIPQRSQRKMQQNCQFRSLIFKTLSQRFFNSKFAIFNIFWFSNFYKNDKL